MAFISKKGGDFWDPRSTEDANGVKTEKASALPTDYIDGWYLAHEENQGKDKNSSLYTISLPDNSGIKQAWGSMLLDDQMKKVQLGSFIRIQWLGKQQPKVKGGRPYHGWEVFVDPDKGLHPSVTSAPNSEPVMATAANNGSPKSPDGKDLPF